MPADKQCLDRITENFLQLFVRASKRGTLNDDWELIKTAMSKAIFEWKSGVDLWCKHWARVKADGYDGGRLFWEYHDVRTNHLNKYEYPPKHCPECGTRRPE